MSGKDKETIITLKGSVDIVTEFFFTSINSILYQRGIYEPASFRRADKYGLTVLLSTDEGLLTYLNNVMKQMSSWLLDGSVQKLVLVVAGLDSGETLERWQFHVDVDKDAAPTMTGGGDENNVPNQQSSSKTTEKKKNKTVKEIHDEIQAIIRQITASVTFLPLLNEPCSFDLLVYTKADAIVPQKWHDSDPRYIMNSAEVKLRSFTTSVHKIDTMVTYKEVDEWEL